MHKLLIEDDEGKTVAVPLIREEITIGRMDGNTIRLTEQNVSRNHARLSLRSGVLRIEDLGSYNGTSLNGSVLAGLATLKDGDVILIGDYRLGIQEDRTSQAVPVAPQAIEPSAGVPTVEGPMDGQPTIPLSTLAAQQTAFMEPPARLVVLGRLLAGTEFVLDRPSLVVGRTPENDIILNHKSISRHHAKIVREGNRYIILDLESANGVRVGGTEHDRVELQSNDVIELGQVRLRFISGDSVYDEPQPWFKNRRLLALAAGGAVLGLILVLVFTTKGNKSNPHPAVADNPPPAQVVQPPPPPPATPTPAPPVQEPPKPEPQEPVVDLIAEAKIKVQAEAWDEAMAIANKALFQEPTSTDAAALRKLAEAEKQNSEKFAALKEAMESKNFEAVLQGAPKIPDDSVYKTRAGELQKGAQTQFIAFHLGVAKDKLAAGDCEQARQEAESVLVLDAKNKKASQVIKRCEALANRPEPPPPAPVAVEKPARRTPPPVPAHAATTVKPKPEPSGTPADPDKLIKDAQQFWWSGQYAAAIDSARKALKAKPNLTNAYQIIAICSCALHDADTAAKAVEKLADDRSKHYVKSACQKNGINF
jgi:ABC transport system ATP-binding/permease protein